jgi:uncharacterized GH25 family protein
MKILPLAALAAFALPGGAHDFWIEPATHAPEPGTILEVRLRVGDWGVGDAVPRMEARIVEFSLRGPGTQRPVVGRDGADPAGLVRVGDEGTYVLAYRSNAASVELERPKFEEYLREKGLETTLAQLRGEGPFRERYSRCAKSIVRAGGGPATGFDAVLGHPIEIVPQRNPCDLVLRGDGAPGALEPLPVRVYLGGQPLAGALVGALDLERPPAAEGTHQEPVLARTDAEGRAEIALPRGGRWLLAAVHIARAPEGSGADFESLWASLTFEAPRSAALPPAPGGAAHSR